MPVTALPSRLARASAPRTASPVARHQSRGSCSAQPGRGDANAACSEVADPRMRPRSSSRSARVPPVPTSMPRSAPGVDICVRVSYVRSCTTLESSGRAGSAIRMPAPPRRCRTCASRPSAAVNAAKVEALANRYGAAAFTDVAAFLAHKPMDIVAIGSPSGLHADQGVMAAAAGLHLYVEKPLDVTTAKADALIDAAARAGVQIAVCFQDQKQPAPLDRKAVDRRRRDRGAAAGQCSRQVVSST